MKATHLDPAGVIATLFDFSFTEFLTLKVVRLVYAVAVLGGGLAAAGFSLVGFGRSVLTGLWTLLLGTFLYLLGLVISRIGSAPSPKAAAILTANRVCCKSTNFEISKNARTLRLCENVGRTA
jgi:hypothetical protein